VKNWFRVFKEGKVLFNRDWLTLHRVRIKTVKEYLDFLPIIERRIKRMFPNYNPEYDLERINKIILDIERFFTDLDEIKIKSVDDLKNKKNFMRFP